MPASVPAAPDSKLNVRYTRKVQENRGAGEDNQVEILEDQEHRADLGSQKARPHTPKDPVRRCFTAATLGVMYLLILAGVFIRYMSVTLEKDELQTRYDRLSDSCSQLQGKISDMAVNNSQLQRSYETLSTNHSQLRDEVKQLKDKIEGKRCPEGWTRFRRSCYFKSNEKKSWPDSRSDCRNKGADLVTINNEEERVSVFVTECGILDVSASDRSRVFLTCCQSASCLDPVTFICPFGLPSAPDLTLSKS
ncbi:C-type lectin domain family 12 member B-like isoform X3 [Siniperca chuatsi]|uniref:C-type lectin domain family 12 member B-like isoform X3 n=1 Tax=Siniperca chuatsi TaxID=119488 RepID=UPI001CE0E29A|nr:C-type lectin domain family 12 member B-like isoform X3 [Siniperca chuatsi]